MCPLLSISLHANDITRMGFHLCFHYAFFNNLSTPPIDYLIKLVTLLLHSFWNKQEKTKQERITHTHTHTHTQYK